MPRFKDYTGQRFGRLQCISPSEIPRVNNVTYWECKCDCGEIVNINIQNVVRGVTKSCGCLKQEVLSHKDYTGEKFWRLRCISLSETPRVNNATYWKCRCDCGKIVNKNIQSVIRGATKSCGCLKRENCKLGKKAFKDYTGQKFGSLECISLSEQNPIKRKIYYWKCKCDCGRFLDVKLASLLDGSKSSCGCTIRGTRRDMLDYTGQKFGHLECISQSEKSRSTNGISWLCKCDCGRQVDIKISSLLKGNIKSCGCLS